MNPIPELTIEPLAEHHNTDSFDCGDEALNSYLKHRALRSTQQGYGRTYVALEAGQTTVRAFYTITTDSIPARLFPRAHGAPRTVSVALIGRLAVDTGLQGQGLGKRLMEHAFDMCAEASDRLGIHALVVDAKNDEVRDRFYRPFGFIALKENPLRLFIPLATVKKAVAIAKGDSPS